MPFKKGQIQPGAVLFKKGVSGNPNGQPRKLATRLKEIGYTPAQVSDTINAMLAMTLDELKDIYENKDSSILEKTIANSLKISLSKGNLNSIDTLLNRSHGKAAEKISVSAEVGHYQIIFEQAKDCEPLIDVENNN